MDSLRRIAGKSVDDNNIEIELPVVETEAKNESMNSDYEAATQDLKGN
jgi:hypothetical protein